MKIDEIAALLSCKLEGDATTEIVGVATLEGAQKGDLSFLANPKYYPEMKTTRASALIVGKEIPFTGIPLLRHDNPYLTFAKALEIFYPKPKSEPFVHPTAVISPTVNLGKDVSIGAHCYLGDHVSVGDRVVIGANCVVHDGAAIGDDSCIHSGCVIRERVSIGKRCTIQSNAVIGSDGFGYAQKEDGSWYKILQSGTVIIEDDVEIGASSTVDRPALGETRIGSGTKIDNLVQIGHSCRIGSGSLLCAQVGLAGSTKVGNAVILAGQAGAAGHLTIGDRAVATAQTGIAASLDAGAVVSGSPAIDHKKWLKSSAIYARLPDIQKAVRNLEKKVSDLENSFKVLLDRSGTGDF